MRPTLMDFFVLFAIGALIGLIISLAKEAECAGCPPTTCYGSEYCGAGCECLIPAGQMHGSCVSLR